MSVLKLMTNQESLLVKICQSIIANQLAMNFNHELKFTPFYKQEFKQSFNKFQSLLIAAGEREYDKMSDVNDNTTSELFDVILDITNKLSGLGLHHFKNISEIIDAYVIDPKSIQGIINKINRKNE